MSSKDHEQTTGETASCEICVNEQTVSIERKSHTAGSIKQAAIEQGVEIDLDFVLSVVKESNETQIIAEEDVVEIEEGCYFVAVAGDDNS